VRRALEDLAAHFLATRQSQGGNKPDLWTASPRTLDLVPAMDAPEMSAATPTPTVPEISAGIQLASVPKISDGM
jgi:hypothetical protein